MQIDVIGAILRTLPKQERIVDLYLITVLIKYDAECSNQRATPLCPMVYKGTPRVWFEHYGHIFARLDKDFAVYNQDIVFF